MKKFVVGSLLGMVLLVACNENSSNKPGSETKPSTTVVRRSIPGDSDVIKPRAKARTKKPSRFVRAKITCNIRRGPGTRYPISRRAARGEQLEYISLKGNWYELRVKKGKQQEWVHKSVVVPSKKSTP
jgi:uncharacterized protein YgiM (DUF1202 family)